MFDHQLDKVFRALASTNRRWMIERLTESDLSGLELAETFVMSLSGVMQHVRVLERCGLVRTSSRYRLRVCRLDPDTLLGAETWMRRTLWANHRPRLGSLPQDWPLLCRPEPPEGT